VDKSGIRTDGFTYKYEGETMLDSVNSYLLEDKQDGLSVILVSSLQYIFIGNLWSANSLIPMLFLFSETLKRTFMETERDKQKW
jgi:hypothetical protein